MRQESLLMHLTFIVQIYMPAYELYLEVLRSGGFIREIGSLSRTKGQLQLVMDIERNVIATRLFRNQ